MRIRQKTTLKLLSIVITCMALISGCSTSGAIQKAHWHYLDGDTDAALQALANPAEIAGRDRLLYWLEKGMYLHYAGSYKQSADTLLQAAAYVTYSDHISLSDEAKELVANEWAGNYRGEYSEQLWIHSVLMMNFLHLGQYESAAVEARRSLEVINRNPGILEKDLFTRALIAISFEAAQQVNDAYIVNTRLADALELPTFSKLVDQQATQLGFDSGTSTTRTSARHAVIFITDGRIPSKHSGSLITGGVSRLSFPEYRVPSSSPASTAILLDGEFCDCYEIHSDFGQLVALSLQHRGSRLATKGLIRAVAKEAIAEAVEDTDKIAGELARLLLFALEEADTRSWRSLPRHFSVVRVPLQPDSKELIVSVRGNDHLISLDDDERQPLLFFTVHAGQSVW